MTRSDNQLDELLERDRLRAEVEGLRQETQHLAELLGAAIIRLDAAEDELWDKCVEDGHDHSREGRIRLAAADTPDQPEPQQCSMCKAGDHVFPPPDRPAPAPGWLCRCLNRGCRCDASSVGEPSTRPTDPNGCERCHGHGIVANGENDGRDPSLCPDCRGTGRPVQEETQP